MCYNIMIRQVQQPSTSEKEKKERIKQAQNPRNG